MPKFRCIKKCTFGVLHRLYEEGELLEADEANEYFEPLEAAPQVQPFETGVTVAELKAELELLGVEYPPKARKAELEEILAAAKDRAGR
jgi:hypothetical protein